MFQRKVPKVLIIYKITNIIIQIINEYHRIQLLYVFLCHVFDETMCVLMNEYVKSYENTMKFLRWLLRGWWFPSFWRITQGWVINLSRFLPEFSVWYRAACYQGKSSWHFKWRGRVQTTVFDYGGEIFFHDEDCLILVSIHYSTAFQYHNEGTEQQCNQNIMLYSPHVPGIIQEQITAMQIIRFSHYHCEEFMCHP